MRYRENHGLRDLRQRNVKRDAWAVWSVPDQKWELESEPFDHAYCDDYTWNCDSKRNAASKGKNPSERQEER